MGKSSKGDVMKRFLFLGLIGLLAFVMGCASVGESIKSKSGLELNKEYLIVQDQLPNAQMKLERLGVEVTDTINLYNDNVKDSIAKAESVVFLDNFNMALVTTSIKNVGDPKEHMLILFFGYLPVDDVGLAPTMAWQFVTYMPVR
jgi:hypothetical protein